MTPRRRRAFAPATWRALALGLMLAVSPVGADDAGRLEVRGDDDRLILALPMPEGERWCLEWNHSVTGIRVQDCYRHRAGRMVLERSHQPDFAAGLGHVPGRGRQVSDGRGGYWIEEIDEPVPGNRYYLRVGSPEVDHRLLHAGRRLSISERAAGERVTIHLRSPSTTPP
ncbi:DUF1850 domain-containing protein [Halomonas sp. EGI 63088]|uniref:DUF1850 domain-containing protein n=1 Tax=Halomonas flagellata TaxID=2920385 RepID=A0ABS9RQQ9_9GAMM|nr:DUF1850 domain-containing protein [Halomonas flagellata]MCH4562170.1 DUF1850 domain-containing protein [Halomonas flagellata]